MDDLRVVDPLSFSSRFADDQEPPHQLFIRGNIDIDAFPTVGIVGSRHATYYGLKVAQQFGSQLAEFGIVVVSGLASGIDGAAHRGALEGSDKTPVLAVVGGGVDVVYPQHHRELWNRVVQRGAIISEYPCGFAPTTWSFPQRNRIIAAMSDVLIVVESTVKSGTRHTVDAALNRDRTVLAVPGPITSKQSEGTNQLLREACGPVLDIDDIVVALSLARPDLAVPKAPRVADQQQFAVDLDGELAAVFAAVDVVASSLANVAQRAQVSFPAAARILDELRLRRLVVAVGDGWVRA